MTYRRNGKLQACEPCRKGKLRCDHFIPHCGRCVKRGKIDKCVYHPAPLTKSTVKRSTQSNQPSSNAEDERTQYRPLSGTGRTSVPTVYLAHLEHTNRRKGFTQFSNSVQLERSLTTSTPTSLRSPSSQSGRLATGASVQQASKNSHWLSGGQAVGTDAQQLERGASFINHAAVLDEHEPSIGLSPPSSTASKISQEHIDQGASVLLLLGDLKSIQKYIDKWFSFAGGVVVIEPMVKIYLDGLWASWHKILESSRIEDLQEMSAQIWGNTSKPLSQLLHRDTTPHEFCTNVTGADLRWEVIGILVSLVSLVAQSLKGKLQNHVVKCQATDRNNIDGDPVFCSLDAAPVDRAALALSMHHASEMCVGLCDHLGVLNDLYLWLLYENSITYCLLRSRGSKSLQTSKAISMWQTLLTVCRLRQLEKDLVVCGSIAVCQSTPRYQGR